MRDWTEYRARDAMQRPVTVIELGTPLSDVARILAEERISGAPVVDAEGRPVGVVSLYDVTSFLTGLERLRTPGSYYSFSDLPELEEQGEAWQAEQEGDEEPDLLEQTLVEEIMNAGLIAVAPDTPLPEVVEAFDRYVVHRLLVTERGALRGVISTRDVLRLLRQTVA